MKITTKFLLGAALALGLSGLMTSCYKGPAEKAGEKIDNAAQDVRDGARDATR
jgi:hypothetical protein